MAVNLRWGRLTFGALPWPPVNRDLSTDRVGTTALPNAHQGEVIVDASLLGESQHDEEKHNPVGIAGTPTNMCSKHSVWAGGNGVQSYQIITLNERLKIIRILSPVSVRHNRGANMGLP